MAPQVHFSIPLMVSALSHFQLRTFKAPRAAASGRKKRLPVLGGNRFPGRRPPFALPGLSLVNALLQNQIEIRYNSVMTSFDASKKWLVLLPPDALHAENAVRDLARCVGLLAGDPDGRAPTQPEIAGALASATSNAAAEIVLNNEGSGPERNGFEWRAAAARVEIFGESGRGLCNGIYSFLSALGFSWPAPGKEEVPFSGKRNAAPRYPLALAGAYEPSRSEGKNPAASPWRRFVPDGEGEVKNALRKAEVFAVWAARRRYDALVFPLWSFAAGSTRGKLAQLKRFAGEYGIALEAGGRDLSALVPRKYFLFSRESFRMEEGKRVKAHHFCPTSPGASRIIRKEAKRLFKAALGTETFHLWPDKGAETAWCSCPTCRAFTPSEQNRMGVNAAADILNTVNPGASLTFLEKAGEGGRIRLRENIYRIEKLPGE